MKRFISMLFCMLTINLLINAQNEARLLRFPTISKDQIVFTYSGDLYTVPIQGGVARKLTNDIGFEMFAKFSPDGKTIAFTGQYDGNTELYTIPATGGVPKRLTYTATLDRDDLTDRMGPNNITMTWRDNENIIFRSRMTSFNDFKGKLYRVNTKGHMPEELPLPCGGFCSYSPDGSKLAYNRIFREFRTWKYYKGGMADDIWIYDFATKQTVNITNNTAQDIFPMWKDDIIYFLSDRDRIMNLFSYNLNTKETKKITDFTQYDIKFPSIGDSNIIFENGGFIYTFNLKLQEIKKIPVIISDDQNYGRYEIKDASKNITSSSFSPNGNRIAFSARGDIFTVPVKSGVTRNLTRSSGSHERNASWSPDGKYIAYISDTTSEDEIYIIPHDGSSKAIQLTKKSDTYKYRPIWSPDSKKLLWADKKLRLQYIDIESKKITIIDKASDWEFSDFTWSPDNKWIAYVIPLKDGASTIWLYELSTAKKYQVTDNWFDCGSPRFSPDGKYLFFTSNRDFNPIYSWTEWNHAYNNMTKIYFVTLNKDIPNPFEPVNDEGILSESSKDKKDSTDKKTEIDPEGIISRIINLPIDAGSYGGLFPVEKGIYYTKSTSAEPKTSLMYFRFKDKKEINLGNYGSYTISDDNKKMLVHSDGKYFIIDLPESKIELKESVDLSNMSVTVDLHAEWKQIFYESWRQMRDFFYDPDMHGVDWTAIRKKYEVMLPYVNHRADLTYLIGEMIGELNVGHAYTGGGDKPEPEKIKMGLLGAVITPDKSGYFRIDKILNGQNWNENTRSPFTEVGVNVSEGDYIIEINGISVTTVKNVYELLINTAGKQVEMTVNNKPSTDNAHKIIITPIADESKLYYYNWVQENIRKVNEATDGKVGYIHIPDMGVNGLNEFVKYYYPQLGKKALIIDDRGNGGGNVSPMIIERLNRELVLMKMSRNTAPSTSPGEMIFGPKICLIDHYSASDGDLFPYRFKMMKIGKIIGTRSWGGVVGIRGSLPFIDGGFLMKPEFAHYDATGSAWIIEGYGVDPDIVLENDPSKEYSGEDEQLNKAIEIILEEMKNYPDELPQIPPFPDKTK